MITLSPHLFMDPLDELPNFPALITSDHLTGPILLSAPLLGIDVWQEAIDSFDALADAKTNAGLPLEQQQYLGDLRVDRYLYDTLAREFDLLDVWLRKSPAHPEAAQWQRFCGAGNNSVPDPGLTSRRNSTSGRRKIERDDFASSILGWRLLCQELAESLLAWSSPKPHDPRGQQIRLWQDSQGFYPQNRLRIWALRFPEDARTPQILEWEAAMKREMFETHPELLTGIQ